MTDLNIRGNDIWYKGFLIGCLNDDVPCTVKTDFVERYSPVKYHEQNYGVARGREIIRAVAK